MTQSTGFFHSSRGSVAGISGLDKQNHPTEAFFGLSCYKLSLSAASCVFQTDAEIPNTAKKLIGEFGGSAELAQSDATSAAGIPQASSHWWTIAASCTLGSCSQPLPETRMAMSATGKGRVAWESRR